jgi:hypothetical protein
MDPQQLALTELITMVGNVDQLWQKLQPPGVNLLSPEGKQKYVLAILEDWIIASLCWRGFEPIVQPGRSLTLKRGSHEACADDLLAAARSGTLRPELLMSFDQVECV